MKSVKVRNISFDMITAYWLEVDHFRVPGKRIREVVRRLGPYELDLEDPRRFSYGLFEGGRLIGVTHLVQWDDTKIRYRTINVRDEYRGRDLGWLLLREAIDLDWQDWKRPDRYLFGWVRRDHQTWSLSHGFTPLDDSWHDDHIAMVKPLDLLLK